MTKGTAHTGYCPICETDRQLERIQARQKLNVRDETIEVPVLSWRCLSCGNEFEGPEGDDHDEVEETYRIYRKKKGFMQPEEIRALRKVYGLTQGELASILGFGAVTLSRYETGMLQTTSQDRVLQLLRDPRSFWVVLNRLGKQSPFGSARLAEVREKVLAEIRAQNLLDPAVEASLNYEPDERSGGRRFDREKFRNATLFFCQNPAWKTAINKYLYYADFSHFRLYGRSITGARYAHAPFGPCPDGFQSLFAWLAKRDVEILEAKSGRHVGEQIHSLVRPDLGVFTPTELKVLEKVNRRLQSMTPSQLSALSHEEPGYKETKNGELISYKYAQAVQIRLTA